MIAALAFALSVAVATGADAGAAAAPSQPDAGVGAASCPAAEPLEALRKLEAALRAGDQSAAVACKDFRWEARLVLQNLKGPGETVTDSMISESAELLETAFRREMQTGGFDELASSKCEARVGRTLGPDLVVVVEKCTRKNGTSRKQEIQIGRTSAGWRVLLPVQ